MAKDLSHIKRIGETINKLKKTPGFSQQITEEEAKKLSSVIDRGFKDFLISHEKSSSKFYGLVSSLSGLMNHFSKFNQDCTFYFKQMCSQMSNTTRGISGMGKEVTTCLTETLSKMSSPIVEAITCLEEKVNTLRLPKEAKDAIPVRLSNGEQFYEAITQIVNPGGGVVGGGGNVPKVTLSGGQQAVIVANSDGSSVGGGDGTLVDGVSSSIKATVKDLANSNPLTTAIVDSNGDQITSFGGGTQYATNDALGSTPTGTLSIGVQDTVLSSTGYSEGDASPLRVDNLGRLWITDYGLEKLSAGTVELTAFQGGSWNVTTTHSTSGIGHGVKTVTTAGTDVALASSTSAKEVTIQAQTDNTGLIAVGATGVDATEATGTGVLLRAGDSITLDCDNLADIFIDSTVNGDGVRFTYLT